MCEIGWNFPSSGGGAQAGFNDPGIETYAGKPFESLAREIIQNSLDARVDFDKPVVVAFQVEDILSSEFPKHADFLGIMKKCLQENKQEDKAGKFFRRAVDILQKPKIACLKVLDYNTTGLRDGKKGDDKHGQWHCLVKATGQNTNENSIAGGSYGIGKSAPFAVSDLRTVFYSTRYEENGDVMCRAQGKSILVSHKLKGSDYSQAIGFYGVKNNCEKLTNNDVPELLQRSSREGYGTTLLIPGFSEQKKWQEKIIAAVISNYFHAIHTKHLEVLIQGSEDLVVIDAESLPKIFTNKKVNNINKDISKDVATARAYYRAISEYSAIDDGVSIDGKTIAKKECVLPRLKHCILWIMLEEGCENSIAILRRGMKITDNQKKLSRRRWGSSYAKFVAVCICDSDKGNALLRKMENPAHDAFEPDRLGVESKDGSKALDELTEWIKEEITSVAKSNNNKNTPLSLMTKFFPMEDNNLYGEPERDFDGGSYAVPKPVKIRPQQRSRQRLRKVKGKTVKAPMEIEAPRVLTEKNSTEKRVMFTPQATGKAVLSLKIAGDSFPEDISISATIGDDNAKVDKGKVLLPVVKNERVKLMVRLAQPTDAAILIDLEPQMKASP